MLVIWGKTYEVKDKPHQFSYPTGFLRFAHRLICLMPMQEAFWIIVGLIRHYPRLWCSDQSSLIADGRGNFRHEITTLKGAIEFRCPEVAKKLRAIGFPLEILVYDSIVSLYSDLFNAEVLYRIWDLIIFYFNMGE